MAGTKTCPLCEGKWHICMGVFSSRLICGDNPRHQLTLGEWSAWVQGEARTADIMRLLYNRALDEDNQAECCVLCQQETAYAASDPIQFRHGYVEGVGQLCPRCWLDLAETEGEEQIHGTN